jgi:p-aminobenzoyl-glutamate transporter AbgT
VKSHRDIIQGMSKAMSTMGYYIVLAFFASLFIAAFGRSNIGALLALKGAVHCRRWRCRGRSPSSASSCSPAA